jgi:uncharacterized protein (TIGR02118 family)
MIKMTYCLRRLPSLSREAFQEYWLKNHGPLVRKHAKALQIRRYVQLHTAGDPIIDAMRKSRGAPEAYDGIAEIWFESREAMVGGSTSPEGKAAMAALREDEQHFIDRAQSPVWFGEEHEIVRG